MAILIGGIDPVGATVELELRLGTVERLIDILIKRGINIVPDDITRARKESLESLQKKYPQLGIEIKDGHEKS